MCIENVALGVNTFRLFILFILISSVSCKRTQNSLPAEVGTQSEQPGHGPILAHTNKAGGALLLPNYKSLEELQSVIEITYNGNNTGAALAAGNEPQVCINYYCRGKKMTSLLTPGVSESDFLSARKASPFGKLRLLITSPYAIRNKSDLERVEILSRRRDHIFGEGDVAFYDLAETMVHNISYDDLLCMSCEELSEKGYLNTFNHVVAQSFMTSIFSETLADFVGDVHERSRLPELITGNFTEEQLADINDGPVDNYIDLVNNEAGQELGKVLRDKYAISRETYWTPELLSNYLNDIQSYHSWAFQIGFTPFRTTDEVVVRFADKINRVMEDISGLRKLG